MAVEYAPLGLAGVLTPQANTTVEPEFSLLWPPGVAHIAARLTSKKPTIEARLLDYIRDLPDAVGQFANAPVDAFAFACTGASYYAGVAEEDALVARIEAARAVPMVTAATAVRDALHALGARRIGLVSPYPPGLTEAAHAYWTARGFTVAAVAGAASSAESFHPIYAMQAATAEAALLGLAGARLEAIVMLGTGMPTLAPIRAHPRVGGAPVVSCMLALAWRTVRVMAKAPADRESLLAWIEGAQSPPHWHARLPG